MRRLAFVIFMLCLVVFLCFRLYAFNIMENKLINETAPDFTLQDLSGQDISLSDLQGKGVIIFFWTTWCPHCRNALSILSREYQDMLDSDIELLAINIRESRELVESYAQRNSLDFPVLLDWDSEVASTYEVVGVPTIVLVSREGKIVSVSNSLPKDYMELLE